MTGMALQFDGLLGWQLLGSTVSGFDATVQCCLVNLAADRGTSKLLPESGTLLLRNGVFGLLTDLNTTRHQCNFAAAETRELVNEFTTDQTGVAALYLQPEEFDPPRLTLNAFMVSELQEERGTLLDTI